MNSQLEIDRRFESWWEKMGATYAESIINYCQVMQAKDSCSKDLRMAARDAFITACNYKDTQTLHAIEESELSSEDKAVLIKRLGLKS